MKTPQTYPYFHCTYVKLKDNTIGVLWSDNTDTETMHIILQKDWDSEFGGYDPEFITTYEFNYCDVAVTDRNLTVVKNYHVKKPKVVECLNSNAYEIIKIITPNFLKP
jgi:hypothetical protein